MGKQQNCALASCSCTARATDHYCSDYCRQADSHGTEKDYCQCDHGDCALSGARKHLRGGNLPDSIQLLPGRLTIEFRSLQDLLEQVNLLAGTLYEDYETLQPRVEPGSQKQPLGSERSLPEERRALAGTA